MPPRVGMSSSSAKHWCSVKVETASFTSIISLSDVLTARARTGGRLPISRGRLICDVGYSCLTLIADVGVRLSSQPG
jgi:hypothetical protein